MLRVMISSTVLDLPEHRRAAQEACLALGVHPRMMEHIPASAEDAISVSLELVEQCDIYVGIFAQRYGHVPDGHDRSITEMEYDRAGELGKPRLIFWMAPEHLVMARDVETANHRPRLAALKERMPEVHAEFTSADNLALGLTQALNVQIRKLTPNSEEGRKQRTQARLETVRRTIEKDPLVRNLVETLVVVVLGCLALIWSDGTRQLTQTMIFGLMAAVLLLTARPWLKGALSRDSLEGRQRSETLTKRRWWPFVAPNVVALLTLGWIGLDLLDEIDAAHAAAVEHNEDALERQVQSPNAKALQASLALIENHGWSESDLLRLFRDQPIDRVADIMLSAPSRQGDSPSGRAALALIDRLLPGLSTTSAQNRGPHVELLGLFAATVDLFDPGDPPVVDRRAAIHASLCGIAGAPDTHVNAHTRKAIPAGPALVSYEQVDSRAGPSTLEVQVPALRVAECEVTARQLRMLLPGADPLASPDWPAANVSWYEAYAYCAWVGGRLPSEAMWLRAARLDGRRQYGFDDEPRPMSFDPPPEENYAVPRLDALGDYAWFQGNTKDRRHRHPVKSRSPVEGLFDMHGNVWEWCSDDFRLPPVAPANQRASGNVKVMKGGGYSNSAPWVTLAARNHRLPSERHPYLGFRVFWLDDAD